MILTKKVNPIESNMENTGKGFTIKASAKAFKILSSGLYSDKIRAVIRELSCNAVDSHTAAGCPDKPIRVTLPNKFSSFFSVQDFGLGMSHDSILDLYSTYFESTKTESNDQIGALGLGSKSPFSYTDSFTVISCYNGVKSTYTAFESEMGEPAIMFISSSETDEVNGVTVTIPVEMNDYKEFIQKAEDVFRPFKVKPEIIGAEMNFEPRSDIKFQNDYYTLYTPGYYNKVKAIQGNIEYPIELTVDSLTDKERWVLKQNIDLNFNIGDLDIAASRESLSYDEQTIKNIRDRLEVVYDSISKEISEELNKSKTMYYASLYVRETISGRVKDGNMLHLLYKGKNISTQFTFPVTRNIRECIIYSYSRNSRISRTPLVKNSWSETINFKPGNEYIFVVYNDSSTAKAVKRVRLAALENRNKSYVLCNLEFIKAIGNPDFIKSDSLRLPTIERQNQTGKYFKKYSHSETTYWQFRNNFKPFNELYIPDSCTKILYVPITKGEYTGETSLFGLVGMGRYIGCIDNFDKDCIIIGIQSSFLNTKPFIKFRDTLKEEYTFERLEDYVLDEAKKVVEKPLFKSMLKTHSITKQEGKCIPGLDSSYNIRYIVDRLARNEDEYKLLVNKEFKEIANMFKESKAISSDIPSSVLQFVNDMKISLLDDNIDYSHLPTKYSLLNIVDSSKIRDNMEDIVNYINSID